MYVSECQNKENEVNADQTVTGSKEKKPKSV